MPIIMPATVSVPLPEMAAAVEPVIEDVPKPASELAPESAQDTSAVVYEPQDYSTLNDKQFRILSCLLDRAPSETLSSVAKRARTTPASVRSALQHPDFARIYTAEVAHGILGSHRARAAHRLADIIDNGSDKDAREAAKFLFQYLDGIKIDVSVHAAQGDAFPVHVLSVETRQRILEDLETAARAGKLDKELARKLIGGDVDGEAAGSAIDVEHTTAE